MKNLFALILLVACTFMSAQQPFTIVLDAGHGGNDTGARHKDVHEKDITLDIAKQIADMDKSENIQIILLREQDQFLELEKRVAIINEIQPDLVLSLHLSSTDEYESKKGTEIYTSKISANAEKSRIYAEQLTTFLKKDTKLLQNNFMILAKTHVPAMIVELGYISNTDDREYLLSDEGQKEVAKKFIEFFNSLAQ